MKTWLSHRTLLGPVEPWSKLGRQWSIEEQRSSAQLRPRNNENVIRSCDFELQLCINSAPLAFPLYSLLSPPFTTQVQRTHIGVIFPLSHSLVNWYCLTQVVLEVPVRRKPSLSLSDENWSEQFTLVAFIPTNPRICRYLLILKILMVCLLSQLQPLYWQLENLYISLCDDWSTLFAGDLIVTVFNNEHNRAVVAVHSTLNYIYETQR